VLVDSHCHLDFLERDEDLDAVVGRAREQDVGTLVTICTKLSEFAAIKGIANRFEQVYCSVGVHPHEADAEGQGTPDRLIELAADPKVVGIGETGLDYYYKHGAPEAQKESFISHMDAARETGLPLIVHTRDADDDTVSLMQESYAKGAFPGVIHCFTAGAGLAEAALDLGFYISLSGIVTFKNATELREVAKQVPLERLLIETDAPYLAPVPMRGKRNEPAFVAHTATYLSEFLGLPAEELARVTTENFFRLFSKARPPREFAAA